MPWKYSNGPILSQMLDHWTKLLELMILMILISPAGTPCTLIWQKIEICCQNNGDKNVGETGIVAVYYNMLNELQMVYYSESLKSAMNST